MKTRGVITLVFDDGYQAVYDEVLPLLAAYNIRAVFAVPLSVDSIAGKQVASVQDWAIATKQYGHELAGHGVTHTDLTRLSSTTLATELTKPAKELQVTTIIYPGGAHNDDVVEQARKTYSAGRTVIRGLETLSPKDPMRLTTVNFTRRNFSVARANIHVLRAFLQNRWLIETYHMVSKRMSPLTHSVLLDDLEAHLDFITSLPVKVSTIREVIQPL